MCFYFATHKNGCPLFKQCPLSILTYQKFLRASLLPINQEMSQGLLAFQFCLPTKETLNKSIMRRESGHRKSRCEYYLLGQPRDIREGVTEWKFKLFNITNYKLFSFSSITSLSQFNYIMLNNGLIYNIVQHFTFISHTQTLLILGPKFTSNSPISMYLLITFPYMVCTERLQLWQFYTWLDHTYLRVFILKQNKWKL